MIKGDPLLLDKLKHSPDERIPSGSSTHDTGMPLLIGGVANYS